MSEFIVFMKEQAKSTRMTNFCCESEVLVHMMNTLLSHEATERIYECYTNY